jgi:predicted PurR-regulated permease PerM
MMSEPRNDAQDRDFHRMATELAVSLGVVALLAYWCFSIVRPFLIPLVWGVVLAVALRPASVRIEHAAGGRRKLGVILLMLVCLGVVLLPTVLLSKSLFDGARFVASHVEEDRLVVPPAPDRVAQWPLVGPTVYETWNLAATNLESVVAQFRPQVRAFGAWLLALAKQAAMAVLVTAVALVIAALLLVRREDASRIAVDVGARIAGEDGARNVRVAGQTIESVVKGVVGVAAIQAALAAAGLAVAGVPGAGLWALLVLILAVAQLPPLLVLLPAILYLVAADASMVTIVLFTVWSVIVTASDAVLKPLLLGRGSDTPMPVILIGAIGGLLLHGLIGLFVGAVVFSTGHRLFGQWMQQGADARPESATKAAPSHGSSSG